MANWAVPVYSRSKVNAAGLSLIAPNVSIEELGEALSIINNWRASHAFPLNTIQVGLKYRAQRVDGSALVAQRIKRLSSIELKLRRYHSMDLGRMQDIGGCRAVVKSVQAVEQVVALHKASYMKHRLAGEKDYIKEPVASGYRGVHLVYAYHSSRKPTYNDLRIEIQIRSQLQHAWATAVETVGTLTRQALKSSQGEEQWLRFFALMGAALAEREKTAPVPGMPVRKALVAELKAAVVALNVERRLRAYGATLRAPDLESMKDAYYFLLKLQPAEQRITVSGFPQTASEEASERYLATEREIRDEPGAEAVLVSVASLIALKKAYPNYFLDTGLFLDAMKQAIK